MLSFFFFWHSIQSPISMWKFYIFANENIIEQHTLNGEGDKAAWEFYYYSTLQKLQVVALNRDKRMHQHKWRIIYTCSFWLRERERESSMHGKILVFYSFSCVIVERFSSHTNVRCEISSFHYSETDFISMLMNANENYFHPNEIIFSWIKRAFIA